MMHAALGRTDAELVSDFQIDTTGKSSDSQAIQDWLAGGCPDKPH